MAAIQPGDCKISAVISATKRLYIHGEPIELTITFSNDGASDCAILVEDPFFEGRLRFKDPAGRLTPRDQYVHELSHSLGGLGQTRQIAAGTTWSVAVFLQTYFSSPAPGSYTLDYSLEVPCFTKDGSETSAASSGTLSFQVDSSNPDQLKKILDAYERQLGSSDWWVDRAAVYAISSMDDPIVVSKLPKLVKLGHSERAFEAVARFRGNAEAEKIVNTAIRSSKTSQQLLALGVLSKWKSEVDAADLKPLLASSERQVRIAALHYVATIGNPSDLPLITGMVDDPDPGVAKEAKKAKQVLEGKNK
jgi:hypothetical protein